MFVEMLWPVLTLELGPGVELVQVSDQGLEKVLMEELGQVPALEMEQVLAQELGQMLQMGHESDKHLPFPKREIVQTPLHIHELRPQGRCLLSR